MASVLAIIFLVLSLILLVIAIRLDEEAFSVIFGIFCGIFIGLLIWVLVLISRVGTEYMIDNKIAMYEEENASIEERIDFIVKNYMDFETRTYSEIKDKDGMNLISLFPELKSDILVQKSIEVYVENNNQIKALKEEKIELGKAKWLLYFGK